MTTNEYSVTGMSCGHCEAAVRAEVEQVPGVSDVAVNASTGRLAVTTDAAVDDAAVIAAVDEAGFAAVRT